jgi:hypothetical protein
VLSKMCGSPAVVSNPDKQIRFGNLGKKTLMTLKVAVLESKKCSNGWFG